MNGTPVLVNGIPVIYENRERENGVNGNGRFGERIRESVNGERVLGERVQMAAGPRTCSLERVHVSGHVVLI